MKLSLAQKDIFNSIVSRAYLSESTVSADVPVGPATLLKMYEVSGHMRSNSLRQTVQDFTMGNILYSQSERDNVIESFRASHGEPVEVHSIIKAKRFVPADQWYYIEFSDKVHFHNKVKFEMHVVSEQTEEVSLDLESYDSDLDPDYVDDLEYDIQSYNDAKFLRQVGGVLGDQTLYFRSEKNDLRNVYAYYLMLMNLDEGDLFARLLDKSVADEDIVITNFFSGNMSPEVEEWKALVFAKGRMIDSLFATDVYLVRNLQEYDPWGERALSALEEAGIEIYMIKSSIEKNDTVFYFSGLISINKGNVDYRVLSESVTD